MADNRALSSLFVPAAVVPAYRTIEGQRQVAAFDIAARRAGAADPQAHGRDVVVDGSRIKAAEGQIVQSVPLIGLFGPIL